jgi:hypothetical protein
MRLGKQADMGYIKPLRATEDAIPWEPREGGRLSTIEVNNPGMIVNRIGEVRPFGIFSGARRR